MIRHMAYLPYWYVKNVIFRRHHPLQTVLSITDHCNLRCKHCATDIHACKSMKSYAQIKEELVYAYGLGSRFVDFEGGEPTLWQDGERRLNDLYDLAHQMGYFSCTLTTNAQQPFGDTRADSVWVSVDGYGAYHDKIRGEGAFEKMDRNIRESGLPHIAINMVINNLNVDSVEETIRYARDNPAISQISLNFITPYPGLEYLLLPWEKRCETIDLIIGMKKQGFPIMNSVSGLSLMKRRGFKKSCWVSNFILTDGTRLPECPGKPLGICDDCGFCMAGEMSAVLSLKPDSVRSGLSLRM